MRYTIDELISRYPLLESCKEDIAKAANIIVNCFKSNHKLLVAGNGGSAADADHIVGELMKSFAKKRPIDEELRTRIDSIVSKEESDFICDSLENGFPCIALHNHGALNTAFSNDVMGGYKLVYAQQILNYGLAEDVFLAISTSGNSMNIYYAAIIAKAKGMKVILLSGKNGGIIKSVADVAIIVPHNETFKIQELHLPIYHWICLYIEDCFFGDKKSS